MVHDDEESDKMKKKLLSMALALALCLMLLPCTALAATADWAVDAADTLNQVYGVTEFSAEDTQMTKNNAASIVTAAKWSTDVALSSGDALTRGDACEMLADAFDLPTGSQSAIAYLYEKNIVNGKSSDDLAESDPVTFAEFSVLAYRVLNYTGGGLGSSVEALKPGTDEYFAWMYLAARKAVSFQQDIIDKEIGTVTDCDTYYSSTVDGSEFTDESRVVSVHTAKQSGEGIWNAWIAALSDTNIGGLEDFSETYENQLTYNGNETMAEAAERLMGVFIDVYARETGNTLTIFTDVTTGDWWYDGVMYSFDAGYINGTGSGTFEPAKRLPLYEFAVLLYRINPVSDSSLEGIDLPFLNNGGFSDYEQMVMSNQSVQTAMKAAIAAGYLSWADAADPEFDPTDTVARKDAVADILRACVDGKNVSLDLSKVNTSILDRFTDTNGLSEMQKQYLAYAVSCGMVNGTSPTTLAPNEGVTRAQAGVLVYRTQVGLDESKMHDYEQNVQNALHAEGGN